MCKMISFPRYCAKAIIGQHTTTKYIISSHARRLWVRCSGCCVNVVKPFHNDATSHSTRSLNSVVHSLNVTSSVFDEANGAADFIRTSQTTSELLDKLVMNSPTTPLQTWLLSRRLVDLHYAKLFQRHVWLQENVHIAHIQLQLSSNKLFQTSCADILEHLAYQVWLDNVEHHIADYSGSQLCECLMSLLYLGVPLETSIIHKLLFQVQNRVPTFSPQAIEMACVLIKCFPGFNYNLIRSIAQRINQLCRDSDLVTVDEFTSWLSVIANMYKLMNLCDLKEVIGWLTRTVTSNPQVLNTPASLSAFVRLCHKLTLLYDLDINRSAVRKLIASSGDVCSSLASSLNSAQIGQICNVLKQNGCYSSEISRKMQQRASSLLRPDSRIYEILHLMYSLCRLAPRSDVLYYSGVLHRQLASCEDVDIVTLSTVADLLIYFPFVSNDLVSLFHQRVVDRMDGLLWYSGRFNRIIAMLIRYPFRNKELGSQFQDCLLTELNNQEGINMRKVSLIASYLLPASIGSIPTDVFNRLLVDIKRWQLPDVYRLANGISFARDPKTPAVNLQLQQLYGAVYSCLITKIESVDSLDLLYQLVLKFIARNRHRDPLLTDRLMGLFSRFSRNLEDNVSAVKIARSFERVCYILPDVYDDLAKYIVESGDNQSGRAVVSLVSACARVGYVPKCANSLLKEAQSVYQTWYEQGNYRMALPLLERLTSLQLFLENDLSRLFTLESIEEIDRYIAEIPDYASLIESCMMRLNRAVVIECPQLDIPWFHEQYCAETFIEEDRLHGDGDLMNSYSESYSSMSNQVYHVLCKVMKGSQFIQRSTYSPYYYKIDFECVLDKKNRPLDYIKAVQRQTSSGSDSIWQRVAIFALKESSYCCNSKKTNGYRQSVKRHLEMMNYKVIEIPHYEWFSMGLTDTAAQFAYIKAKLTQS